MRLSVISLVFGFLALTGCSGTDVLNALTPSSGYQLIANVRYGPEDRHLLDLYVPDGANGSTPTIVFFYGGSWQSGSRDDYRFVGEAFAARGYQVAIPDYRLYPDVRFPTFLEDSATAVAWVGEYAQDRGVAAGPLYLVGHSAGAYNAAMLGLDPRWLVQAGSDRSRIVAIATLAGPFDFLPLESANLKAIFGPKNQRDQTQPLNYVDGLAPPMLLTTGADDDTVYPRNTINLAAKIKAAGGAVETRFYKGLGHLMIIGAVAKALRNNAPVVADVDAFFRRNAPTNSS